jgi:hypothetical protein
MPAQAYQLEPMPTPDLLLKASVAALTVPWGALGGMTRSSALPNMSVHSRRGEQSHSRTLNPATTRLVERALHERRQPVTYGILIRQYPLSSLSLKSPWITLQTTADHLGDHAVLDLSIPSSAPEVPQCPTSFRLCSFS